MASIAISDCATHIWSAPRLQSDDTGELLLPTVAPGDSFAVADILRLPLGNPVVLGLPRQGMGVILGGLPHWLHYFRYPEYRRQQRLQKLQQFAPVGSGAAHLFVVNLNATVGPRLLKLVLLS